MSKLNIVYRSNKHGNGLPCSYLAIKLQKADLSTKARAIKMIESPFVASHGHKTKHLNWPYPFLPRVEYCNTNETQSLYFEESSFVGSLCCRTVGVTVPKHFKQDAT